MQNLQELIINYGCGSDFRCTPFLSPAVREVRCDWDVIVDDESSLSHQVIGIGFEQLSDKIVTFEDVPFAQYNWKTTLQVLLFNLWIYLLLTK